MYATKEGKIIDSNDIEINLDHQSEADARIYYLQNPYPNDTLKDFLEMAMSTGNFDGAAAARHKSVINNPHIDYELDKLQERNLLDKTRQAALTIIEDIKNSGGTDE